MLGIDITFIPRFKNASKVFIKKFLHPIEIIEYEKSASKAKFLASRWAIKEALFKSDNSLSEYNKILISKKNKYIFPSFIISTSTEGDYCVAIVQKEKNDNKK